VLGLTGLLVATASLAGDPTLLYRAPTLAPHGGAWSGGRSPALARRDLHVAEVNARAQASIEAAQRDNMRRIDDAVIVSLGNPDVLPLVRRERELEADLAAMRQQERGQRIEADLGRTLDGLGRPLGPTTRRVFEENGIRFRTWERKQALAEGMEAVRADLAEPAVPALGDLSPAPPGIRD